MTDAELVEYYTNLLIIQYRTKQRAPQHVAAILDKLIIFEILRQIESGYDVDTAVGEQQDILGKYLGVDRTITGTVFTRDYFGYSEYGDTAPFTFEPFIQYSDDVPDVQFRRYEESSQSLYDLTDEEFREIQKLAILFNSSNFSTRETDDLVVQLFGDQVVFTDRYDMTISYIFANSQQKLVQIAESQGLIPRAMAVNSSVSFIEDPGSMFAFGTYGADPPDFAEGFGEYGVTPVGSWLTY